jgi:hypothetical protein
MNELEFRCPNCGKTKPIRESRKVNLLARLILYKARVRTVCAPCILQVNFFVLFILSLFALMLYVKFTS